MLKLRIALRYLFARKSHSAVNAISLVSTAGICLATAALVVVLSVFNGFHALIESRLSVLDAPVSAIPASGKSFESADSLCGELEKSDAITMALPVIEERALAVYGPHQMVVRLRGIPPELYGNFTEICPAGSPWEDYFPGVQPAVVSVGVSNALQVPIGYDDPIGIYVPKRKGRINPGNPASAFRTDSVAPSAVFALNQEEVDADVIYAPIDLVARLLQYSDQSTDLFIYPSGSKSAAAEAARHILGPQAKVMTLEERSSETFRIVNMEKWVTFMLLGFILLIASFNVISSLSLLIIEKEPNAATLRALGFTPSDLRGIYMRQGVLITVFGTLTGALLGTLLSLGQQHYGWIKLSANPSDLSVMAYPTRFDAADLLPIIGLALLVGLITSFIATRR